MKVNIVLYTSFALVAFAFNSILCRLALRAEQTEAFGFTTIRLVSGAVMLTILCGLTGHPIRLNLKKNVDSGAYLFLYALLFSLAYYDLSAGVGALLLFGAVQLTMIGVSIFRGERPKIFEWVGLAIAVAGLVYLVSPGLSSPPLFGALFMAGAGASWGLYSLRGKGSLDPIADTNSNFVIATMLMLLMLFLEGHWANFEITRFGVLVAVFSGAITSGIGYVAWYAALKHLTSTSAAVLQLSVPLTAAFGGVILLSEPLTQRLLVASFFILGGIAMTIAGRSK